MAGFEATLYGRIWVTPEEHQSCKLKAVWVLGYETTG
jgi:hypothetical protein